MMLRSLFLFTLFNLNISLLLAQEEPVGKKTEKQAKKHFKHEDFRNALPLYLQIHAHDSINVEVNYRIGVCYFNLHDEANAEPFFSFVKAHAQAGAYENTGFYLGRIYHSLHKFDQALVEYEEYVKKIGNNDHYDKELLNEINKFIRNCQLGKELVSKPVNVIIKNSGEKLNTDHDEMNPVVASDGKFLFFSSKNDAIEIPHKKKNQQEDPGDIFSAKDVNGNLSRPMLTSFNLNSPYLDAPLYYNADDKVLYFSTIVEGRSNEIMYTQFDGFEWKKPRAMTAPFNSEGNETGFCLSADGNTAFFSSDRAGGYGGQDIYMVKRDESGRWGKAINMGPTVNSPFSEEAPFISADGKTLFFSSNGLNSIGGFDIFRSRLKDSVWMQPENLGFPVNSAADDKFLTLYGHGMKGYFTSKRTGGKGGYDIHFIQFIDTTISPAKYLTNFHEEQLYEEALLKPAAGKVLQDVIYFDFNASRIADFSMKRIYRVLLLLNTYPDLKLELQGYTDNKGTEEANHVISDRRAKAVYSYLLSKGIHPDRLKPVGYGAENPVSTQNAELEQAKNRRVAFKVLPPDAEVHNSVHTGKYYVVKGTFSNEGNAKRMVEKLKEEGVNALLIEPVGGNKYFRVVLLESLNYEHAHEEMEVLRQTHGEGLWILSF